MATEVEAKFLAENPSVLEAIAAAASLGDGQLGPAATIEEVDIYLDTPDGRLDAAGWACRLRDRGSRLFASLKGQPGAGRQVAGDSLVERFRLRQQRTERGVRLDGEALGTLSLD